MADLDDRTDDELLRATAAGNSEAFAVFYDRHLAIVVAYLMRRVSSPELAADLAGETFAAALLACRRYRATGEPAIAWLLGIARHKLIDSARRGTVEQRARRRVGLPVLAAEDENLARTEQLATEGARVLDLLEQLPEEQRAAVRGRVLDERDYQELSRELGCSEQVVRQRVSRGLRRLKDQLERS